MKRAVLYSRVSADDRSKEGRNLASQLEMGQKYAGERGYQVVAQLAGGQTQHRIVELLDVNIILSRDGEDKIAFASMLCGEGSWLVVPNSTVRSVRNRPMILAVRLVVK